MPPDSNRVLLSTADAAKISGLSREYISRLLRRNRIEGVKLGGHDWLVYEDSLKSFIAYPRKSGPKGPHKNRVKDSLDPPLTDSNHEKHEEDNS
jgi:excisionase family DNA binding protein